MTPWWADEVGLVTWWESPAFAYAQGLRDGAQLAAEQFDNELDVVLRQFLGGGRDRREAIDNLIRSRDQLAARQEFDAAATIEGERSA